MPSVRAKSSSSSGRSTPTTTDSEPVARARPKGPTRTSSSQSSLFGEGRQPTSTRPTPSRTTTMSSGSSKSLRALQELKGSAREWLKARKSDEKVASHIQHGLAMPKASRPGLPKRMSTLSAASLAETMPKALLALKKQTSKKSLQPVTHLRQDWALKAGHVASLADAKAVHAALTELHVLGAGGRIVRRQLTLNSAVFAQFLHQCAAHGLILNTRDALMLLRHASGYATAFTAVLGAENGPMNLGAYGAGALEPLRVHVLPRVDRKDFLLVAGLTDSPATSRQAMRLMREEGLLSVDYLPLHAQALTPRLLRRLRAIDGFAAGVQAAIIEAAGDPSLRLPTLQQFLHALFFAAQPAAR